MAMVIIGSESLIRDEVFTNYRQVAAFNLGKGKGSAVNSVGREIEYEKLGFLPNEDTINGIKSGDIKLKKVIKKAVKVLHKPSMDSESATLGLGVTQLITLITSDRKAKKGIPVVAFITDQDDPERNKILVKFIKAILGEFGIKTLDKAKVIKKIFKKRKKARDRVASYCSKNKNGCNLSQKGVELKKLNFVYFEMELRQSGMVDVDLADLADRDVVNACVRTLLRVYTAENLKDASSKSMAKKLAKKDRRSVRAYNDLREILLTVNANLKLPKVKYGQKKKNGRAVKPKLNCKKFKKFFMKKDNRALLVLIYWHTLAILVGVEAGSKEYNAHMKLLSSLFKPEFIKQYLTSTAAYVKGESLATK